jgi:N-acetylglutamate synthase-like GNAT family acetyltransferase
MLAVEVTIRPARSEDSAAAAAVVHAVYDEHGFTWEEGGYHADLADVESSFDAFWVAERNGAVVGCVGLRSDVLVLAGTDCSLERLYVLAGARGDGTGSALLRAAVAGARKLGRTRMEIWSDKLLTDAHRLYERHGATVVAERRHDDPDRSEEWGLALELAPPTPPSRPAMPR